MTKPVFNVDEPVTGYKDAPVITAEQMSRFLYCHIGRATALRIAAELNGGNLADYYGALQTTYVAPEPVPTSIYGFEFGATVYSKTNRAWTGPMVVSPLEDQTDDQYSYVLCQHPSRGRGGFFASELTLDETESYGYVPPKPTRLPIERPVRLEDVEPGDVLLYCGVANDHEGWPIIGSEVVVVGNKYYGGSGITYSCTTKQGTKIEAQGASGHCVAQGFSFVRRPFKAGEAVRYKADATACLGWEGALLVDTNEADRPKGYGIAVINHKGVRGSIDAFCLERIL